MGNVTVHDGPEPLDGIEMWATVFARQKRSDIGAFVIWSIVPNKMNNTFFYSFSLFYASS